MVNSSIARKVSRVLPHLLAGVVVAALALGVTLRSTGIAFADGNCAPYQNGLSTYQNQGCVYNFGNTPPYSKNNGDFLYISVIIDYGFPSNIQNDILTAMNNWNNSSANVRMSTVGYSNFLELTPSATPYPGSGITFATSCTGSGAWGQSWGGPGSTTPYHQVLLDSNLFSQGCGSWDTSWIGVAVHEMGHAMGLAHNAFCYYCTSGAPQCVNAYTPPPAAMCARMTERATHLQEPPSSGTCTPGSSSGGSYCVWDQIVNPQVTDYWIFNQIYPSPPISCLSTPSNQWCDGMDPSPSQQNCINTAADNEHKDTPYGWVEIWYSAGCQSNWTKGGSNTGWAIYRIQIKRGSGSDGGATTIEDAPNQSTWYTSMIYSPHNSDQSCISFINTNTSSHVITQWYCTGWH